jgi:hypothetical protein
MALPNADQEAELLQKVNSTGHIVDCSPDVMIFHDTESFARRCCQKFTRIAARDARQGHHTRTRSINGTHLLRQCGFLWNMGQEAFGK